MSSAPCGWATLFLASLIMQYHQKKYSCERNRLHPVPTRCNFMKLHVASARRFQSLRCITTRLTHEFSRRSARFCRQFGNQALGRLRFTSRLRCCVFRSLPLSFSSLMRAEPEMNARFSRNATREAFSIVSCSHYLSDRNHNARSVRSRRHRRNASNLIYHLIFRNFFSLALPSLVFAHFCYFSLFDLRLERKMHAESCQGNFLWSC
jgi:hypothetical protein